ncbi:MAG: hypothetical protein WB799_19540 [Candidatus Sulfotelmatobacter sp.]
MKKRHKKQLKKRRKPSSRVFSWAVNKVAIVDKIVLSVDGQLKPDFEAELQHFESRGILTPDSLYSRAASGSFWLTGNLVDVVYGRTKNFKNVPAFQITMHSTRIPLTAAQVLLLVEKLIVELTQIRVSSVELTSDFTGVTIGYVLRHLVHRAQNDVRVLSDGERTTIYVGSPRSAWQVRIYQKTRSGVLRLEFILRRSFLSRHGINKPEDVLLLRKLNVWDLLSVRRFSASSAARVTRTWDNEIGKELVRTWGEYRRPLRLLPRILKNHGVHPYQVLRPTRLQEKMQEMQRHFIW